MALRRSYSRGWGTQSQMSIFQHAISCTYYVELISPKSSSSSTSLGKFERGLFRITNTKSYRRSNQKLTYLVSLNERNVIVSRYSRSKCIETLWYYDNQKQRNQLWKILPRSGNKKQQLWTIHCILDMLSAKIPSPSNRKKVISETAPVVCSRLLQIKTNKHRWSKPVHSVSNHDTDCPVILSKDIIQRSIIGNGRW